MGGAIEVVTAPGKGTEIIIRLELPLARREDVIRSGADTGSARQEEVMDFSGRRLLLVEDNEINREIAVLILTEAGFDVDTAENGQIAVSKVSSSEPGRYDLILMDIQMPVMNGYEASKAIRALENEALAAVPIIAMTANAFKEDEQTAAEAGMQAHIAKPLNNELMLKTISWVLRESE